MHFLNSGQTAHSMKACRHTTQDTLNMRQPGIANMLATGYEAGM